MTFVPLISDLIPWQAVNQERGNMSVVALVLASILMCFRKVVIMVMWYLVCKSITQPVRMSDEKVA